MDAIKEWWWVVVMASMAWLAVPASFVAASEPEPDALESLLLDEIPGYWSVTDLRIVASIQEGDAVDPQVRQRFEADVSPDSTLYVVDEEAPGVFEPFAALVPATPEDRAQTLYGTVRFIVRAGEGRGEINLENRVDDLGKPRSLFEQPTFVVGSEEEKDLVERLKSNRLEGMQAELDRALESLLQDHGDEVDSRRASHATAIIELKREHDREVEALKELHAIRIAEMEREPARFETVQQEELEQLRAQHAETIEELDAQLRRAETEKKEAVERGKEAYAQEIAKLEAELSATDERIALLEQLETRRTVLSEKVQETLTAEAERVREITQHFQTRVEEIRKQAEDDDPMVRQEFFETGMESEHATVREASIKAALNDEVASIRRVGMERALASDDPWVREDAIVIGLESKHPGLRDMAINAALADDNVTIRRTGMELGLASGDTALQEQVLRAVIQETPQHSLWLIEEGEEILNHLYLNLADDAQLTGARKDSINQNRGIQSGAIQGPAIHWTDTQCSGHLAVAEGPRMEGTLECRGSRYPLRLDLF